MRTLTLDYLLDGDRRGYTFTTPTDDLPPDVVKALWRGTMPRGQGWGEDRFSGARALKVFGLPDGSAAICDVIVTDQRDELGRRGIRRAVIALGGARESRALLSDRLRALPPPIVAEAERRLTSREWALLFRKYRDAAKPRSFVKPQTLLAYPYTPDDPSSWTFVEACLLLLATRATLLTNLIEVDPAVNPFADRVLSFTTLALDFRDEGRIVALPLDRACALSDAPFIDLTGR
ncbi:MAG: hypothetical protein L6Q98_21600 [Anaerolineae bacterium]|nr:hypothetical protein [Anaerolineae bacterium]NUQ06958.1 hypothetical protein [Anaerolineae bacterium]